jgi:hypothetical protein
MNAVRLGSVLVVTGLFVSLLVWVAAEFILPDFSSSGRDDVIEAIAALVTLACLAVALVGVVLIVAGAIGRVIQRRR